MNERSTGHIVVVGSLNMDLVVRSPRLPQPGETIMGSSFQTFPGGKGANQAVAAARLGAPVKMIGRVGMDAFGNTLLESTAGDQVDVTFVYKDDSSPTGITLVTIDDAGENTIVTALGANFKLTPQDVSNAEAAFEGASILLVQLEIPTPAIYRAVELAHQHNMAVILNPAPVRNLVPDFLRSIDFLIPNQTELALLAGMEDFDAAANMLYNLGLENLIVTLGEEGALVITPDLKTQIPALRVPVVDTVAAGDAFVGAFAVALNEGQSVLSAATFANRAAAFAVTREGAQPSLPTRQDLDGFPVR